MNQTVSIQRLCNPRRGGEACPFTVGLGSPMEEKRPLVPILLPLLPAVAWSCVHKRGFREYPLYSTL